MTDLILLRALRRDQLNFQVYKQKIIKNAHLDGRNKNKNIMKFQ